MSVIAPPPTAPDATKMAADAIAASVARTSGPRAAGADRRGPLRPGHLIPTRKRLPGHRIAWMFQAGDGLALALLSYAFLDAHRAVNPAFAVIATLSVLIALSLGKAYEFSARQPLAVQLGRAAAAGLAGLAGASAILALLSSWPAIAPVLTVWGPMALTALVTLHAAWWLAVRRWRRSGRLTPNIVVVGATRAAERLIFASLKSREVNIIGVFDDRADRAPKTLYGVPVLGDTDTMMNHRVMPYVDRVVITVPAKAQDRVSQLIERLRVLPNEITLLLDGEAPEVEAAAISRIADVPLARISGPPVNEARALAKRAQDLVIGSLALVVSAPVMAIVALAIKLDSPGPALFRQRRHGFNNEEIVVWKFRSMRVEQPGAQASQVRQVQCGDDRVTRIGRFIRKTSLDELPQIFNVLTGEMSLVGPRPHPVGLMTGEVESARLVHEYAHRHRMKPGMTGWAAIHGSRGPVDTPELVQRRVALDVEYIERQSFWLDLYIIAMTIPCLLGDSENVR
ncbi:exopolysaccharide biosynthesis polyprenyl glycosylphosphotransferase [Phenylobacterium aquaticum]|uniref:exopolysaccharide biosynthesis polyprenyl glycosylphosphotransferase n=1 Tax=Phenylobacterium aquaticum TaxID=1763816 RepID=UPI0023519CDD|nr:exopolysaccharide biosynthesis polyprenyl glycosylphosphotransferase [Phenylobacterium aquaticum]